MSPYTTEDDRNLVAYMAIGKYDRRNRLGSKLYRQMVFDEDWAKRHTWSSWREHYRLNQETLDRRIETYQDKHDIQPHYPSKKQFTPRHDKELINFLAENAPMTTDRKTDTKFSRQGEFIYKEILSNFQKYPWASSHPWRSWRERYINHMGDFDEQIARWQEKKGIDPSVQINLVRQMYKNHRARMVLGMEKAGNDKHSEHESHLTDERHKGNGIKRPRSDRDDYEQERSAQSTDIDVRHSKRQNRMHLESIDSSLRLDIIGPEPWDQPSHIDSPSPDAFAHSRATTSPVARVHSDPSFSFQSLEPGLRGQMSSPGDAHTPTPVKRANSLATSSRAITQSISPSSFSDGPFGTCPSSPRRIQVVHELPKSRKRSFRNGDRTRMRKVIPGCEITSYASRGSETDENEEPDSTPHSLVGIKQRLPNDKLQRPSQNNIPPIYVLPDGETTRIPAAPAISSRATRSRFTDDATVQNISDVFTSVTPRTSGTTRKPYLLNTSHLPSRSSVRSGSPLSSVSIPTLPNGNLQDFKRRHTFPHSVLRAGLPYIDLLAELKTKRKTSRSSSVVSAMRSPDVTFPGRGKSRDLVSDVKSDVMRRGPSRSIIPLVTESKTSTPRDQLSPSSSDTTFPEDLLTVFKLMGEKHGFSYQVVRRIWGKELNLKATDMKLRRMRTAAEMVVDADEEAPASEISKAKDPDRSREEHEGTLLRSVPDTATASPTDYTPPYRSRAGHYRRFIEQGRYREAQQREIDLTSRVSAHSSISSSKPSLKTKPPIWGKKEDEALLTSSEGSLRSLAEKFGENFIRRKTLSLMMREDED